MTESSDSASAPTEEEKVPKDTSSWVAKEGKSPYFRKSGLVKYFYLARVYIWYIFLAGKILPVG